MSAVNCDTLNNIFLQAKNLFQEPIYNWTWRTNPFISMFTRREFEPMDGLIPEVITTTSELPTSYPFDLSNLTISNGTASTSACDIEAENINPGYISRNYQLEIDAWKTPVICLTDLQFDWKAEQQIANFQKNLAQFSTVRWSDWYRVQNIRMINTKVSTLTSGAFDMDENSDSDFSGVAVPTAALSWDHLDPLYDMEMQLGASENAVGMSEGQPLLALSVGPGYKRLLFQTDDLVRDTVNWGDAFQNFAARGINTSINGYIPNIDLYPIRYDAGMNPIYPTLNANATSGRKNIPNPAWKTVSKFGAQGGLAVYENFSILTRDIYEVRPRPTGPTAFGQATFDPVNYVGEINWINNKTFGGCNDQGTKGYYRLDLQMAAKPVRPEVGIAGITLALD